MEKENAFQTTLFQLTKQNNDNNQNIVSLLKTIEKLKQIVKENANEQKFFLEDINNIKIECNNITKSLNNIQSYKNNINENIAKIKEKQQNYRLLNEKLRNFVEVLEKYANILPDKEKKLKIKDPTNFSFNKNVEYTYIQTSIDNKQQYEEDITTLTNLTKNIEEIIKKDNNSDIKNNKYIKSIKSIYEIIKKIQSIIGKNDITGKHNKFENNQQQLNGLIGKIKELYKILGLDLNIDMVNNNNQNTILPNINIKKNKLKISIKNIELDNKKKKKKSNDVFPKLYDRQTNLKQKNKNNKNGFKINQNQNKEIRNKQRIIKINNKNNFKKK